MGTPQSDLAHILSETATTEEVVSLFEELEPVQLDFMTGRWRGAEIPTGPFCFQMARVGPTRFPSVQRWYA